MPNIGVIQAQTPDDGPLDYRYTVQPGDTLALIALRHNLNMAEIILANQLTNPSLIFPGQLLSLPGYISPQGLPAGDAEADSYTVQPGDTLAAIAAVYSLSTEELMAWNNLLNPDVLQVGQTLFLRDTRPPPEPLPDPFVTVAFSEPEIIQGRTLVVRVTLAEPASLRADFEGQPIFFHHTGNNQYWGLVAIHALIEPNSYPLRLTATTPDGRVIDATTPITVIEGPYGEETIWLTGDRANLLQPELIQQEREKLVNLWSQITPRPRWEGPFWYPVAADTLRITSYFGTRRLYNDSAELSFHGGTDFGGGSGTPIYAPAAGTVVLAEPLTVRGNAVLIDHGLGLFSGYWHQSETVVTVGQEVQPGQLIGYIGDTGLVTGPHLHWEMRLNGIAVNPMQWIRESIP